MKINGNNFLQVYENGTHGDGDWKYYGNTLLYSYDNTAAPGAGRSYIELVFLDSDDMELSVYDELYDEVQAVNRYPAEHGMQPGEYVTYYKNYLQDLANRGVLRDWTTYKFCFEDASLSEFKNDPGTVMIEYPEGTVVQANISEPSPNFFGTRVRMYYNYVGAYPDLQILVDISNTFDISLDVMEVFKEELKNYQDEQKKST